MTQAYRCYAYGSRSEWQALCVDFDIAVQGVSFDDVQDSLATAIKMYLETVAELPPQEQPDFLSRRTPWQVRASLASSGWLHRLSGGKRLCSFTLRSQYRSAPV